MIFDKEKMVVRNFLSFKNSEVYFCITSIFFCIYFSILYAVNKILIREFYPFFLKMKSLKYLSNVIGLPSQLLTNKIINICCFELVLRVSPQQ